MAQRWIDRLHCDNELTNDRTQVVGELDVVAMKCRDLLDRIGDKPVELLAIAGELMELKEVHEYLTDCLEMIGEPIEVCSVGLSVADATGCDCGKCR